MLLAKYLRDNPDSLDRFVADPNELKVSDLDFEMPRLNNGDSQKSTSTLSAILFNATESERRYALLAFKKIPIEEQKITN